MPVTMYDAGIVRRSLEVYAGKAALVIYNHLSAIGVAGAICR
jgi:hypothetical protein